MLDNERERFDLSKSAFHAEMEQKEKELRDKLGRIQSEIEEQSFRESDLVVKEREHRRKLEEQKLQSYEIERGQQQLQIEKKEVKKDCQRMKYLQEYLRNQQESAKHYKQQYLQKEEVISAQA